MQEEQVVQGCPVIQKKEKKKEKLIGHLILAMRDYSSAISTDSKKQKQKNTTMERNFYLSPFFTRQCWTGCIACTGGATEIESNSGRTS
jgi:hypothetical protein